MLSIEVGPGTSLHLLPERAIWLAQERALLVADVHIGKAGSFRRLGVPVPEATTADSLQRLEALIERHRAEQLVFLGDFLHSEHAHAPATLGALREWRERHRSLGLTLVRGNHDDRAGDPPRDLGVEVVDEPWRLSKLALSHHPRATPGAYTLAGHLHPCAVLSRGLDHLRLPCFWLGARVGVLPAFGAFTGMKAIRAREGDRVFGCAEGRVVPIR